MEQTITINVPEGKEIKQVTDEKGNIIISYVDKKPVKSKSWLEFLENHENSNGEYYISTSGEIKEIPLDSKFKRIGNNNLSTRTDAEGILALIQLTRLRDEWVGDWRPHWETSSKYDKRYTIVQLYKNISIDDVAEDEHMLSFPTMEMATEFRDCFKDLIEKAKRFI